MERNRTERRIVLLVGDYQNNHLEGTMGTILRFHTHARASAASSARTGGIAAKASKVICEQPNSLASRTNPVHRLGGMPRVRQVLTVLGGKPSAADTAPVPPRASIAEPAVSDIAATIVRNLRTSQEFATRETTSTTDYGSLGPMIDPPEVIGPRLKALRLALNIRTQTEFAKKIGVEKNTYNPWENGKRPLTFEGACLIRRRFKIPVDYMFWGDHEDQLPAVIQRKLESAA